MKVIRMGFWVKTLDPMVPGIINYVVNWSTPGWVDPGFPTPTDEAFIMRSPVNAMPVMPGPPNPDGQWAEMYYVTGLQSCLGFR